MKKPRFRRLQVILASLLLGCAGHRAAAAELLIPSSPLQVKGTKGAFDFITIDVERRRLLAAHTGNNSLDVIDLDQGTLVKSIPLGAAQDCAVDPKAKRYLVSVSKPPQLVEVDAVKLEMSSVVRLDGPADLLACHPSNGYAYVDHDDGKELWVVDVAKRKVIGQIDLTGDAPEDLAVEPTGKKLFQAMKAASVLSLIDVESGKVTANWSTAPAKSPHGIALVPEAEAVAVAGGNGKLVLMSQTDGRILSSGDMPERVDQIAYDAGLHRIYCASGTGKLAIFSVEERKLVKLGEVATAAGARSVAVDAKTHTVWVVYAQGEAAFAQAFAVPHEQGPR